MKTLRILFCALLKDSFVSSYLHAFVSWPAMLDTLQVYVNLYFLSSLFLLIIIDYRTDVCKHCSLRECAKIFSKHVVKASFINSAA